jgi:hypothetical protein
MRRTRMRRLRPLARRAAPGPPLAVAPHTALAPYRDPSRRSGYPFPKARPPIKAALVPHARAPEPRYGYHCRRH